MNLPFANEIGFNSHSWPLAVVSSVIFLIGVFILSQNFRAPANLSFFVICFCVTSWLLGNALMYGASSADTALNFYRAMTFLGVSFVSTCVYGFSVIWLGLYPRRRLAVLLGFAGSLLFYLLGWVPGAGFIKAELFYWGWYPKYGWSNRIFLLFFFGYFLAAFYNFIQAYRTEKQTIRKTQIRLIAAAFLVSLTGSVDYIPKFFDAAVYPFGFISVFTWILLTAYSIVKYKVMDIETVIHKTLAWLAASSVIGLPVIFMLYIFRDRLLALQPVAFGLLTGGMFVLIAVYVRNIQPHIDHIFQRRKWDLSRSLERFADELVHRKGLEDVAGLITQTVATVFYASRVSLTIPDYQGRRVCFRSGEAGFQEAPVSENEKTFLNWLESSDAIVFRKYVSIDPRMEHVAVAAEEYFQKTGSIICVPLVVGQKLVGVINLSDKTNLQAYGPHDITFLSDLRRSAAIAISNALYVIAMQENLKRWNEELEKKVDERTRELKETQAQLVQAEKLATIGTLAGGIAHEINNPLTAVLANAQLLKMNVSNEDAESVELIEEGAKRCQIIIQKLMKYSRKQEDKTAAKAVIEVNRVIDSAVGFLEYQLRQECIELRVKKSENVPGIDGNSNELEQVLTNLILNAKDAIKSTNQNGLITVSSQSQNDSVRISVSDTGVGIPKENLPKLFDPFFTTKEIGKGTGLGLAVSFGIVQKFNGRFEVFSELGKGSTFSIIFPKEKR